MKILLKLIVWIIFAAIIVAAASYGSAYYLGTEQTIESATTLSAGVIAGLILAEIANTLFPQR